MTTGETINLVGGLQVSAGAGSVTVQSGVAMVDGTAYVLDSDLTLAIPTPAVATRVDRIVLRRSWAAQTTRVTRIAGVEGGGAPAIAQTDGDTWDAKLAQVSITPLGTITVTMEDE